jgi:glutathione synthase/RimK-type ligase-like ATP-grasp enzyme
MQTNISLVIEACQQLNIPYEIIAPNQNLIRIKLHDRPYFFVNFSTPFDSEPIVYILRDKEYTYHVLKGKIKTPKTLAFLSPFCEGKYRKYLQFQDCEAIAAEAIETFALPVVVKRNRGSGGNNVFLCQTEEQVKSSIATVFNVNSKDYDYVCLAQEYIEIDREYRAVFFDRKLVLLYEKDKSHAKFAGNLSPLHWDGARAKHISDSPPISEIENFVRPVFQEISINYAGFDIALDRTGQYWLIEINSSPNFDIFVRDNDRQLAVKMFRDILENWK